MRAQVANRSVQILWREWLKSRRAADAGIPRKDGNGRPRQESEMAELQCLADNIAHRQFQFLVEACRKAT